MPDYSYEPALPISPIDGFIQTVRVSDNSKTMGHAKWHVAGDAKSGVVQLLELEIAATFRRAGHGQRLLETTLEQIRLFFRSRKIPPRRVWMNVNQKDQVIGRALLTELGFHHMATIPSLLKDQDALIYVLSLD